MKHVDAEPGAGGPTEAGRRYERCVERELTVQGVPTLRVVNGSGDTRVITGPDGVVRIRARVYVLESAAERADPLLDALELKVEQLGDVITLHPYLQDPERMWRDLFRGRRFGTDLEIVVPREARLDLQATGGAIAVMGVRGVVAAQGVSGAVEVEDVHGPLRLRTVSGSLRCRSYVGQCECTTVSGALDFEGSRLRGAELQTVSGGIRLEGDLAPGAPHHIRTISGDVSLALAGASYRIEYKSMSGNVDPSRGDEHVVREGRHERLVGIGDGATRVKVRTVSGDLALARSSGPVAESVEGERLEPAAAPDPTRSVLERVARGELGVDEAAAALAALGATPGPGGGTPTEPADAAAPAPRGKTLRIRVTEGGEKKVDIAIPLAIARVGKVKLGGLVRGHLGRFGIDLDEVMRDLQREGRIVDVAEGNDRVEIFVE